MAKAGRKKEKDFVIRCAGIGLTELQIAYILNVSNRYVVKKYREIINNNLPDDYMQKRWRRLARACPKTAAEYNKIYVRLNKNNPIYRIKSSMANQVIIHCKKRGIDRNKKAFKLLPFSAIELKEHLEQQFESWMNWDNYGSMWHIDHRKPVSWFNFKSVTDDEFMQCWSLGNLQPLDRNENMRKGNNWSDG